MILYNVTVKIDESIHSSWLKWMKEEHIPEVLETGMFKEAKFWKLLNIDEGEGLTYAVQYLADSIEDYQRYVEVFSSDMRKRGMDKWGDRFIAFRTVMELVQ